jgi:hypothetical protein
MHATTSKVENLAKGLSCQLKFVHVSQIQIKRKSEGACMEASVQERERVCVCVCARKLLKFSNEIRSMANVIAIQDENRAFINLCLF